MIFNQARYATEQYTTSRLLQHIKESWEYKKEAQQTGHGALYRVVQDYLLGVRR